jgi:hypothetical protein
MRVHTHVGTGRGRFRRAFFFNLFSSCSVHPPLPPPLLLLQQLLPNTSSYSYKSMMMRDVGNRERRNIVTISVFCVRIQTLAHTYTLSLSLYVRRKDVTRTCTLWTSPHPNSHLMMMMMTIEIRANCA